MSWDRVVEYKGLKFAVHSGMFMQWELGETVGIFPHDPDTIEAIKNRDERIFEFLDRMVDDIEEFSHAQWAQDAGWFHHWGDDKSVNEIQRVARMVVESKYASDSAKNNAQDVLDSYDRPPTPRSRRKK